MLLGSLKQVFGKAAFGFNNFVGAVVVVLLCICSLCDGGKLAFVNNTVLALAEETAVEPKVFFADNPDGSTSIIGNWFTFTSFTLSLGFFGFAFMIACIATASYYVLVVVTEPSQQHRRMDLLNVQPINTWNWERILRLIHLAYQTYTTLDLDSMECQNKILCEFQETPGIVGSTTRRVSNFLMYFNAFKSIPHIRQYQEAVERGQRRRQSSDRNSNDKSEENEEVCGNYYKDCLFSVRTFNTEYNTLFNPLSVDTINGTDVM